MASSTLLCIDYSELRIANFEVSELSRRGQSSAARVSPVSQTVSPDESPPSEETRPLAAGARAALKPYGPPRTGLVFFPSWRGSKHVKSTELQL